MTQVLGVFAEIRTRDEIPTEPFGRHQPVRQTKAVEKYRMVALTRRSICWVLWLGGRRLRRGHCVLQRVCHLVGRSALEFLHNAACVFYATKSSKFLMRR